MVAPEWVVQQPHSAREWRATNRTHGDFKGRHFEATLIVQAVSWYLRYPLSYRDIEELFLERGLDVDHSTLNRWVLAYAPLIERRLRVFRKPHCGSVRIDKTYIRVRGQWRYLYRAVDKHGAPVDFLLSARRDLEAAKRFFRKMLEDQPLLAPDRIGTDAAGPYPPAIVATREAGRPRKEESHDPETQDLGGHPGNARPLPGHPGHPGHCRVGAGAGGLDHGRRILALDHRLLS